ncbi:MBL fold metallo-hydrolase [Thermophilibacter immobilis]|uniref:MBL fold metallo-hydrolase n=1 Tax=Thermophilibacter immobilis TaxID=2779519 RepID=A0A7S7M7J5_9ACTN|nr:MBL fold metallo-hydrolase [Thermophilibacter immobilis]QOY60177.1 MBL fold metallo-hydrolase [Thermophilibacter immobilis]
MTDPIQVDELDHGVFALSDPLGCRSYLVVGERRAALVDTMSGVGDVRAVAKALAGGQPVDVLLTYRHPDHASGAYRFERVAMTAGEDGHWEETEKNASAFCVAALDGGLIETANVWPVRPQRRPRVTHVGEKDRLDLGGLSLTRVLLPGHTNASAGYLCPERAVLFSGDAVRPIMCLRFEESLPLSAWRRALAKMEGLDFERFYTGHHAHAFCKADLASFDKAARFAQGARGFAWQHGIVDSWTGICHLCPCKTYDAGSPDFRAVITAPGERSARLARVPY